MLITSLLANIAALTSEDFVEFILQELDQEFQISESEPDEEINFE